MARVEQVKEMKFLGIIFLSPAVFTKTMVQGPTRLANVGAGAFSTWDAVHPTFPAIGWYWVLGCTSSCLWVLKGRKVTRMARGAKTLQMHLNSPLM